MNPVTAVGSAASAKPADSSPAEDLLYQPLDFVMVRAPLLPVKAYLDLAEPDRQLSLLADAKVRRALVVGSASLADAVERSARSGLTRRDADRMRAKVLRYLIRMSTRPTPFGLFAGVALSHWGRVTDLTIRSTCSRMRTRPDMAWLLDLVVSTEANPAVRKRLNLVANPLAVVEADRVFLPQQAPKTKREPGPPVSVRATAVVKQTLLLARQPIAYADLVTRLCEASASATPEKVDKLLTELWEQTFLLTDLRPPLTAESPARYVAERLASIPEAGDSRKRLEDFLGSAAAWDRLEADESVPAFRALLAQAGGNSEGPEQTPVQVDMAMAVEGRLAKAVAEEAARAAELLLRLSPFPYGLSSLAAYRQAFVNRYGTDREVALLELLDPHRGLGPMFGHGHAAVGPDPPQAARRAQTLLHLACSALHDRQAVVILDENCLKRLQTCHPNVETAPISLDINFLVGARSPAAIDAGDFTLVVGPNLGAQAAGRNLARFSDLFSPEGRAALKQAASMEEQHTPAQLWAEFVYLPGNIRSANVVIRPAVRSYEAAVGISPGVPPSAVIPLDELTVGVQQGRFYVRWQRIDKRVIFSSGHMLNYRHAPPVGQFLMDLMYDGKTIFSSFDWGPAEGFPYLPRVQAGRIVLRPAEWRIQKDDTTTKEPEIHRRIADWRRRWDVPRHICVSFGDNRLILDLDQDAQTAELAAELQKLPEGGAIMVQEVLPALEQSWLAGGEGQYYSEFVASLILRPKSLASGDSSAIHHAEQNAAPSMISESSTAVRGAATGQLARWQPPGSEWLFVKLYCPRNLEDDVISESMHRFADNAVASEFADSWFFIRYSDPEPHIRLRFHGLPERLTRHLFGHVCDWAANLMSSGLCIKFAFDTYEQEIERFGGSSGMTVAEGMFFADSRGAAGLLHCLRSKLWPHDQTSLLILSIDDLLSALGFDENERLEWYGKQATAGGPDVGSEYRQRKGVLRSLLGQSEQFLRTQPGGAGIASVLAARRQGLSPLARHLRELAEKGALSQSLDVLASSFVHLHLNRMASLDTPSEQHFLSLLLRVREGLRKAPVVAS